jgi:hypothetical protein
MIVEEMYFSRVVEECISQKSNFVLIRSVSCSTLHTVELESVVKSQRGLRMPPGSGNTATVETLDSPSVRRSTRSGGIRISNSSVCVGLR